jgi:PPOX class probable F420-dependent enzyme
MTTLADLADEKYLLLTTFRRTGEAVATPVWAAGDGAGLVVTTMADSGKVKRLRHTPSATVQACDMRGRVRPGAPVVAADVSVADDAGTASRTASAMTAKYGLAARFVRVMDRLRRSGSRVVLRLQPA